MRRRTLRAGLLASALLLSLSSPAAAKHATEAPHVITGEQAERRVTRAWRDIQGLQRMNPVRRAWASWLFNRRIDGVYKELVAAKVAGSRDAKVGVLLNAFAQEGNAAGLVDRVQTALSSLADGQYMLRAELRSSARRGARSLAETLWAQMEALQFKLRGSVVPSNVEAHLSKPPRFPFPLRLW
ncbi:MAG: hypothetical protein IT371_00405 [Deltaproteobacteria bacterium]|nr:hypothetical protein [Deltaproteobacteria bacterium]